MSEHGTAPAINLVTGEGCEELPEAIGLARQDPGQPVTDERSGITVTWYGDDGKQVIEFNGEVVPAAGQRISR